MPEASLPFHRAAPSVTHMALVELERAGILKFVISQVKLNFVILLWNIFCFQILNLLIRFVVLCRMWIAFIFVLEYQGTSFQNCMEIHLGRFVLHVA